MPKIFVDTILIFRISFMQMDVRQCRCQIECGWLYSWFRGCQANQVRLVGRTKYVKLLGYSNKIQQVFGKCVASSSICKGHRRSLKVSGRCLEGVWILKRTACLWFVKYLDFRLESPYLHKYSWLHIIFTQYSEFSVLFLMHPSLNQR